MEYAHDIDFPIPTRRQVVDAYLAELTERDRLHAASIAEQIADSASPLADTLVLIPVAAHQEAPNIHHTLAQYADQTTARPFTVILGLNSPTSEADRPGTAATLAELRRAQTDFPWLDIRSALTLYDQPTIGTIRRDLWNGTLTQAHDEGAYQDIEQTELIGINHDIDTVSINPRYIERIQQYYDIRESRQRSVNVIVPHLEQSTLISHAPSPEHPNISRGVYWADLSNRAMGRAYEAGLVFPLSHYAEKHGFPAGATGHETARLWTGKRLKHAIPGTTMQTSPRRFVDRLSEGYENVWAPGSFGATDSCRTVSHTADISSEHLESIIRRDLKWSIVHMAHRAVSLYLLGRDLWDIDDDASPALLRSGAEHALGRRLLIAEAALRRVVGSPPLGDIVRQAQADTALIERIVEKHIPAPPRRRTPTPSR